jgi:hypothetical protein
VKWDQSKQVKRDELTADGADIMWKMIKVYGQYRLIFQGTNDSHVRRHVLNMTKLTRQG